MTLSSDALDILLRHDHWATRRVLEICATLTPEQFGRKFEIGPGSLHHTLAHTVGAMRRWADRIVGRELRPSIDALRGGAAAEVRVFTPQELVGLLDEAATDLAVIATEARLPGGSGLDSVIEVQFGPTLYRFTRGAALVHIGTHGMHHRAQCMNMIRRLGLPGLSAEDLPEIGVCDWQAEVETKQLKPFVRPAH
ncbi:MAG: DinB family protein [Planctomycetota bacterium]